MSVDTLTLAQRLRASELPTAQAEAIAAAIGSAVLEGAATKADLEQVRVALKADIEQVRVALKADIEQARVALKADIEQVRLGLETRLEAVRTDVERSRNQVLVGFISTQIALAGLVFAAVKLF